MTDGPILVRVDKLPKNKQVDDFTQVIWVIVTKVLVLDFHNKVTTSETLISDYKVRSQVRNNVKSSLIMVYYLY